MSTKPSLVMVHGSWHSPAHCEPLATYLQSKGYEHIVPVSLPSVHPPNGKYEPGIEADVLAIRHAIEQELDADRNVVLVLHSYAGVPGMMAPKGLDTTSRTAAGKTTSVIAIACLACWLLPVGKNLAECLDDKTQGVADISDEGLAFPMREPGPKTFFYGDLSVEEADKWTKLLRPQHVSVYFATVDFVACEAVPTTYLVTERDGTIHPDTQRRLVAQAAEKGYKIKAQVCDSDHSPFLCRTEETGDFIRGVAGEGVKSPFPPL